MQFTPVIASVILLFSSAILAAPLPQLAGEGAALNSIASSTDNGIGFGVKAAEDNTAGLISKVTASVPKIPRQADKIANGLKNIGNAAGISAVTEPVGNLGDSADGALTGGVADAGAQIGNTEEATLISVGQAIPKTRRERGKIANGPENIGNAAGISAVTEPVGNLGDSADGALTGGVADAGAKIGSTEESTLISIGQAIPK